MKIARKIFFYLVLLTSGQTGEFARLVIAPNKPNKMPATALDKKLRNLIKLANESVNLYKNKFTSPLKNNSKNFSKTFINTAPITYKSDLKQAGQDALANKYQSQLEKIKFKLNDSIWRNLRKLLFQKDFIFLMSTGGTTGTPLMLYKNKNSLLSDALLFLRGWQMMGWRPGDKALWFYNAYYDNNFSFINRLSFITGIKLFFFESLSDDVIAEFVKVNNQFKPKIIVTFPSYINDAANTIRKSGVKLTHFPDAIEVSGETLTTRQRQNIEQVFKSRVYDSYGALEFGMIAHECQYQTGMHIYEDVALLESLNHDKDKGCLTITRYDSFEMPIIRYQVGDLGNVQYQECECGRRGLVLKNVEGRIDDYIILPNGQRMYPSSFRIIINNCNEICKNTILESQLIQNTKDELLLKVIISDSELREIVEYYLIQEFKKHIPGDVSLKIMFIDSLRDRKKFRFIERTYEP